MVSSLLYSSLSLSWILVIISTLLTFFSYFKNTKFRQNLLRALGTILVFLCILFAVIKLNELITSAHITVNFVAIIAIQTLCNIACYISIKQSRAKSKASLDYFSME